MNCLGLEDGCYSDWSLDLLVAKKVWNVPHFSYLYIYYLFGHANCFTDFVFMFARFWELRRFLYFRIQLCLKVEVSMWMEKVRVI